MVASLSSAEAEELEPTAVFEDRADCMGLIFWLSGMLVQTGMFSSGPDEQDKVLAGGRNG